MKKFHLTFTDPVVIEQGAPGDNAWGHYQFPSLKRTTSGGIFASWSYASDTIEYTSHIKEGIRTKAVSDDEGKTWRDVTPEDKIEFPMMKNGKRFVGFCGRPAHVAEYIGKYTPVGSGNAGILRTVYLADDIEETEDKTVSAMEQDPVTGEITTFPCEVHWPWLSLTEYSGQRVYPTTMVFSLCSATGLIMIDGDMYFVLYHSGLNSDAKTREEAIPKYPGYLNCYVFKSGDCGRTWEYLSQILTDDFTYRPSACDGLGEPMMSVMPDGSVVMLIRSGFNIPSYIVRSTDKCRTWSKVEVFDTLGVMPQILTLPCGVTLATYGRPEMHVRATGDPAGLVWQDPIVMKLSAPEGTIATYTSCFYTRLLPLTDTSALMIYSDFQYPNKDGEPVKSVVVREIRVVED